MAERFCFVTLVLYFTKIVSLSLFFKGADTCMWNITRAGWPQRRDHNWKAWDHLHHSGLAHLKPLKVRTGTSVWKQCWSAGLNLVTSFEIAFINCPAANSKQACWLSWLLNWPFSKIYQGFFSTSTLALLHFSRWTETCKTQCFIRVLRANPTLTCLHCGHYSPLRTPCF